MGTGYQHRGMHLGRRHGVVGLVLSAALAFNAVEAANLTGVQYEAGTLKVSADGPIASPRWNSWKSEVNNQKTEVFVMDFPGLTASPGAKQMMEDLTHRVPDIHRFLARQTATGALRIFLEVSKNPGQAFKPAVSISPQGSACLFYLYSTPRQLAQKQSAVNSPVAVNPATQTLPQFTQESNAREVAAKSPAQPPTQRGTAMATPKKTASATSNAAVQLQLAQLQVELSEAQAQLKETQTLLAERTRTLEALQHAHQSFSAREAEWSRQVERAQKQAEQAERATEVLKQERAQWVSRQHQEVGTSGKLTLQSVPVRFKPTLSRTTPSAEMQAMAQASHNAVSMMGVATSATAQDKTQPVKQQFQSWLDPTNQPVKNTEQATVPLISAGDDSGGANELADADAKIQAQVAALAPQKKGRFSRFKKEKPTHEVRVIRKNDPVQSARRAAVAPAEKVTVPQNIDEAWALQERYIRQGRYQDAETVLNGILQQHPDRPQVYLALIDVYLHQKMALDAFVILEAYEKRYPQETQTIGYLKEKVNTALMQSVRD